MPANCDDGDACTTDVCQGGTCVHSRQGYAAAICEVRELQDAANLCAPDPIHPKIEKAIVNKSRIAGNLLEKSSEATRNPERPLGRAIKQLTSLRNRIAKAAENERITESCGAKLDAILADRLALAEGLMEALRNPTGNAR